MPILQSPLRLAVNADAPDLAAWATWLPPGMRIGRTAGRQCQRGGQPGHAALARRAQGEALALSRPADGLALEKNGQLRASLQDELVKLDTFSLRDRQGGELSLSGQANWRRPDSAQFTLNVRKLAALSHPSRSLSVSGQAQLRQQGSGLLLSGGFTVDQVASPCRTATPQPGRRCGDCRPARAEPDAPLAIPVAVALDLDLGEQFRLSGKGLDVKLAGRLRLAADAGQAPRATGAVRVVSGHYAAYGQRWTSAGGVLTFVRRLDDPAWTCWRCARA